jgi:dTDP-4-dehydrorhamnose reductase
MIKDRIVVLGAGGMAGHVVSMYLENKGYLVYGFSRVNLPFLKNCVVHEIDDFDSLMDQLNKIRPRYIINCVGILNKSEANEIYQSIKLNSLLPRYLEKTYASTNVVIIHISTDCVFSGNKGNYKEDDMPDGVNIYDRTKALGEIDNSKDLTIRCSIVGPDIKENGIGLFNWFINCKSPIRGYGNVYWTGVTTLVLAKAIEEAILNDIVGIYNLASDYKISKFDLLKIINRHLKNDAIDILLDNKYNSDKSLIDSRRTLIGNVRTYEEMIIEMKGWIKDHFEIYPHYDND